MGHDSAINPGPLTGKVGLVTGGARRVGAQLVRRLHAAGANVLIHYRDSGAQAERLQAELQARRPDSAQLLQADLLATAALPTLAEQAVARWGRLDVLINNASTFYPTPLGAVSAQQWEALLGSNLRAPFFLAQALAPALAARQGVIINIVDVFAARPKPGFAVYSIAKAGLAMMTQALAVELGPRQVRVNGVAPGAVMWPEQADDGDQQQRSLDKTALRRMGDASAVADAVYFLIAEADYVTGHVLPVDGGRLLHI